MGSDHFAVLQQPRRPWLDPDQLKERYQEISFALHPDRQKPQPEQIDFAEVAEAYRVLSNPRLRLQHLLTLEGDAVSAAKTSSVPDELADLFMEAANLIQQIDNHRQKREQTATALGKSLLQADTAELQKRAGETLKELESRYNATLEDLRRTDDAWSSDSSAVMPRLRVLADVFGYLDRWIGQLRERQFQLAT
jgi:curved DNA-binding protein CbpA